ncbi:hypothetical protein [Streptomyces sp. NPDC001037]|uniref:hypothetical protein n=1 Tax=Streptomyces sp. NPDC001037 TaxID=3364542 RepID=UPI0036961861
MPTTAIGSSAAGTGSARPGRDPGADAGPVTDGAGAVADGAGAVADGAGAVADGAGAVAAAVPAPPPVPAAVSAGKRRATASACSARTWSASSSTVRHSKNTVPRRPGKSLPSRELDSMTSTESMP